jgi:hypothetical protein
MRGRRLGRWLDETRSSVANWMRKVEKKGWAAQQKVEWRQCDQLALRGVYSPFFRWIRGGKLNRSSEQIY